jgi:hypothetical protein
LSIDDLRALDRVIEAKRQGLVFEGDGKRVIVLSEDGCHVPLGQIYHCSGDTFIIGEVIFCHATIEDLNSSSAAESREGIIPLVVLAVYRGGQISERIIRPYMFIKRFDLDGTPIFIETKTRYASTLNTLMSLKSAQIFVGGEDAPPDWLEAYSLVVADLKRFACLDWDSRLYDVVACWIIATYFQEILSTLPFLYPYGPTGTGKTRLLKTVIFMARHGFLVTDPSEPSLFRMADALKPSLGIDESLLGPAAWKIIRTSFKRGTYVPRIEKTGREEFILGLFETFMPVAFSSTEMPKELGGVDADEARCIFIFMQQQPDPAGRDPEERDFNHVRDALYLLRLGRAGDVIQSLKALENADLPFAGHEREIWLPLLSIARLIGLDVYNNILDFASDLHGIKILQQNPEERAVTRAMLLLFRAEYAGAVEKNKDAYIDSVEFKSADLREYIRTALEEMGEFDEALFERRWSNEKIGRILTRMGIFKRAKKGRSHYIVTPDKICALYKQFLVGRAVKSPSGVGDVGDVGVKTEEAASEKTPTQPEAGGERSLKQASLSHFGRVEKVEGEVSQKPTDLNSTPTTPTSPTQGTPDQTLTSVIQKMRLQFSGGPLEEFLNLAVQHGLSREEANSLFKHLVRDGCLALTPYGEWRWTR